MKKLKLTLFIFVFSFLFTPRSFADFQLIDDLKIKGTLQSIFQKACKTKEIKIQNRITSFNENKEGHIVRYSTLKDRLLQKLDNWEDMGYDIDQLREDYSELDEKVKKFATDYTTYISELEDTQNLACNSSSGEFADALSGTRDALRIVREDARAIRQFYQNTIRPHILELRDQIPSPEGE